MDKKEAIGKYQHMAFEEFDKQFTKKDKTEFISETLIDVSRYVDQKTVPSGKLRRTQIRLEFESWGGKPVDASLFAMVYMHPDRMPFGEANHIRKVCGEVDIKADMENFYKRFGWGTNTGMVRELDPYDSSEREFKRTLVRGIDELLGKRK